MMERKLLNTKNVVLMGMFGALAAVLMLFEVPLPFLAPSFYGLDFAEVPMLVGTFALGPAAGIVMQIVKILIKLILKPTSTGFVGEFANVVMSCALILPAGFIYRFKKSKTGSCCRNGSRNGSYGCCGRCNECSGHDPVLFQLYAYRYHYQSRSSCQSGSQQRMDTGYFLCGTI